MSKLDELIAELCPCLPPCLPAGRAGRRMGWKPWFTYVLLCDDGSLYKGHTNDIVRRYGEHSRGTGARYTKVHKPVRIVLIEGLDTLEEAVSREKYYKSGSGREWLQKNIRKDKTICLNLTY